MKKKKLIIIIAIIIVILIGGVSAYFVLRDNKKETPSADALKFKEEYESLNDSIRESDGAKYNNVSVPENNPIKYVDCKEALEILKNETAILYVGANWCPWCRNIVSILIEVAKDMNVDTIYYLNLDEEKDLFEVVDNELVKTTEGTDSYYELLDFLSPYLRDYVITNNNKEYATGEKRIYMPFVVVTKNGEIKGSHTGSVDLNEDQTKYDTLTEEQHDEVYRIYEELFKKVIARGKCDDDCN